MIKQNCVQESNLDMENSIEDTDNCICEEKTHIEIKIEKKSPDSPQDCETPALEKVSLYRQMNAKSEHLKVLNTNESTNYRASEFLIKTEFLP